jgi:hypothetical protein
MDELEKKLAETQDSVETAITELNSFSKIKKTLETADQGLTATVGKIDVLSKLLTETANELKKAGSFLSEAVNLMKEADPAKVLAEQKNITVTVDKFGSNLKSSSEKTDAKVDQAKKATDEYFSKLSQELKTITESIKKPLPIIILLLVANLIIGIFAIVK